jgi:hypothetical protein
MNLTVSESLAAGGMKWEVDPAGNRIVLRRSSGEVVAELAHNQIGYWCASDADGAFGCAYYRLFWAMREVVGYLNAKGVRCLT